MTAVNHKEQVLTLRDGINLSADLWFPTDGKGSWPALLMRQPYGKKLGSTITYAHPSWWASHGYLVIVQDVRGQGASEGEFTGFKQEAADTTETHQWVRSLPECNGLLGTYGFSYQGITQILGEQGSRPPECMAPAMTGINEGSHWSSNGDAFWWHIGLAWGLQLAALKVSRSNNEIGWKEIRQSLETNEYLVKGVELLNKYDPKGMACQWLKNSEKGTNYFRTHNPLNSWLKQPILLIGGWWDPHLNGILEIYHRSIKQGGQPELHIGPATHLQWWQGTNEIQLDFFNRHLKNADKKEQSQPKRILWNLTSKEWTPIEKLRGLTNTEIWSLRSTGSPCANTEDGLLEKLSEGMGQFIIVHDPWRAVPAIGGHLSPTPGKAERLTIDKRGDVATFTTNPFEVEKLIEGIPKLQIKAKSNNFGFDLCVALSIIYEDKEEVHQLSIGVRRIRGTTAKEFFEREVILQPILAHFPKGSQLRISISGALWPAIAINPGTDNDPCGPPSYRNLITEISMNLIESKFTINSIFSK